MFISFRSLFLLSRMEICLVVGLKNIHGLGEGGQEGRRESLGEKRAIECGNNNMVGGGVNQILLDFAGWRTKRKQWIDESWWA